MRLQAWIHYHNAQNSARSPVMHMNALCIWCRRNYETLFSLSVFHRLCTAVWLLSVNTIKINYAAHNLSQYWLQPNNDLVYTPITNFPWAALYVATTWHWKYDTRFGLGVVIRPTKKALQNRENESNSPNYYVCLCCGLLLASSILITWFWLKKQRDCITSLRMPSEVEQAGVNFACIAESKS